MLEAGDPGNAFLWPVLHLHDMRDGVGGPDVAGVARDGVAAGHLRGAIVAGLLEGEGLQPPHIAVAGHARVPGVEWPRDRPQHGRRVRSEEHTSELQSLMRISYAVFCLKKNKK